MFEEQDDGTEESKKCPFCGFMDNCEHLLLFVDLTFRNAEGGRLYSAFGRRWGTIAGDEDDDFDEAEAFDELLNEVDSLADSSCSYVREGGPSMTSEYCAYYCSSIDRVASAVQKFPDIEETPEKVVEEEYASSGEASKPASGHASRKTDPPQTDEQRARRRAVLVIVTDWPYGTMAFKFGTAMRGALHVQSDDIKLVQMGPERIFRAETETDENSFFEALSASGVSYSGRVLFVEL